MFTGVQGENPELSALFILAYLVALPLCKMNRDVLTCLGAAVWAQVFCFTSMYNEMLINNPHHILTIYAIIYSVTITHLREYKVMLACALMVITEIAMLGAYNDGLFNKSISDYIYAHYELAISVCHACIIISLVQWGRLRYFTGRIRNFILRSFSHDSVALYAGGEAGYNRESKINQEDKKCKG